MSPADLPADQLYAPPLCAGPLRRFLVSHAVPGLDRVDLVAGEHSRLVAAPHGPAVVTLVWGPGTETPAADRDHLLVRLALADPDDLVLRRALGAKTRGAALALAEPWRPWRGYALVHLWTSAVFA